MLTALWKKRYDKLIEKYGCDGSCTRDDIAALWGVSKSTVGVSLAMFKSDGLPVPKIIRAKRESNSKYESDPLFVNSWNMGDPSMPECPRCKAAGRHGARNAPVHLAKDFDGVVYCPACAYDPGYNDYKAKLLANAISRRREKLGVQSA